MMIHIFRNISLTVHNSLAGVVILCRNLKLEFGDKLKVTLLSSIL